MKLCWNLDHALYHTNPAPYPTQNSLKENVKNPRINPRFKATISRARVSPDPTDRALNFRLRCGTDAGAPRAGRAQRRPHAAQSAEPISPQSPTASHRDEHEPEQQAGWAAERPSLRDDGGALRDPHAAAGAHKIRGVVPQWNRNCQNGHGRHQTRTGRSAAGQGGDRGAAGVCRPARGAKPQTEGAAPQTGAKTTAITTQAWQITTWTCLCLFLLILLFTLKVSTSYDYNFFTIAEIRLSKM